jgi:hypothetical protein
MAMSGFLLTGIIVAVFAAITSIGLAVSLLFSKNKELFNRVRDEVFSDDKALIDTAVTIKESETPIPNWVENSETSIAEILPNNRFLEIGYIGNLSLNKNFVSKNIFGSILAASLDVTGRTNPPYSAEVFRNINQKALDSSKAKEVTSPFILSDTDTFARSGL